MAQNILEVDHVSKSVQDADGVLTILHDINFQLQARESVAIVGASGSGKSTLLSILAGLDTPSEGTVWLRGQDMFALDEDGRAALRGAHLGFVFQSFQLLAHLTALENVMLPLELRGERDARAQARQMLERVGLGQRLSHYPRVLSGGAGAGLRAAGGAAAGGRTHRQPRLRDRRAGDGADVRTQPGTGNDAGDGHP